MDFSKEIYWKRTKEEYDKKQELLEQMKKDKISSEIKKREEKQKKYKILKLKEKKENEKIKEAEKEKMEKMRKKENELKSEAEKLKKRIIIDCERAQRNEQFKQELKKFRGKSNDTKVKFILKINSISNGNDLIPVINKKYTILPEIPNNNNHFRENSSDLKLSGINRDNEQRIDIEQKLNSPKANSKEKEKENPNNNISKNQNGQNKVLTIKNNKNNNLFQEIIEQEKYEVYEKPNKKNENEFKGSVEKYRKGILYLANKNKNIAIKNYIIKIGNKEKENLIYKLDRKQKFFNVQKNKKRIDKIKDERRRKRYEVKNKNFDLKRNADEDIKNLIDNILRGYDP